MNITQDKLRALIEEGAFELYGQPQVDVRKEHLQYL